MRPGSIVGFRVSGSGFRVHGVGEDLVVFFRVRVCGLWAYSG